MSFASSSATVPARRCDLYQLTLAFARTPVGRVSSGLRRTQEGKRERSAGRRTVPLELCVHEDVKEIVTECIAALNAYFTALYRGQFFGDVERFMSSLRQERH